MASSVIPLHYYIAYNKPKEAVEVMQDFGYTVVVRDKQGVANTIAQFISREGEKGLKALAAIHPDRDLILSTASLGADGFSDRETAPTLSKPAAPVQNPQIPAAAHDHTPLIVGGIIASALLVSVAVICRNN